LRKLRRLESAKRRRFEMTPPLQWNSPREKSADLSVDQIVAAAVGSVNGRWRGGGGQVSMPPMLPPLPLTLGGGVGDR
jgi:hypothetical protein